MTSRSYSQALQRAVTDFGADHAFNKVSEKFVEHYGITVSTSMVRVITEHHASQVSEVTQVADQGVLRHRRFGCTERASKAGWSGVT